MDLFDKCYEFRLVDDCKAKGLYPYFHEITSRQHSEVQMDGHRTIMLGSNNYLGLTSDDRVIEAAQAAAGKFGSGCSGSRFLNGTLSLHTQLERELAEFFGKEAVMTFPSGFQTNLGILSSVVGRHDVMFFDRTNHASLIDGARLSFGKLLKYDHNNMKAHPKLYSSYSDGTSILNAVWAKTGLVTYYGQDPGVFRDPDDYNNSYFEGWFVHPPMTDFVPRTPWQTFSAGTGEGIIVGGYTLNFAMMMGGDFFPFDETQEYLLIMEDHEAFNTPAEVSALLSHVGQSRLMPHGDAVVSRQRIQALDEALDAVALDVEFRQAVDQDVAEPVQSAGLRCLFDQLDEELLGHETFGHIGSQKKRCVAPQIMLMN